MYVFRHVQQNTFLDYLLRHREWGFFTFGSPDDGRNSLGPLDHIKKEIKEIEDGKNDLKEWIDLIILSFDGLLRTQRPGDKDHAGELLQAAHAMCPPPMLAGMLAMPCATIEAVKIAVQALEKDPLKERLWVRLCATAMCGFGTYADMALMLPALFEKQTKNSLREWGDWRKVPVGVAIEHVRGFHD